MFMGWFDMENGARERKSNARRLGDAFPGVQGNRITIYHGAIFSSGPSDVVLTLLTTGLLQ